MFVPPANWHANGTWPFPTTTFIRVFLYCWPWQNIPSSLRAWWRVRRPICCNRQSPVVSRSRITCFSSLEIPGSTSAVPLKLLGDLNAVYHLWHYIQSRICTLPTGTITSLGAAILASDTTHLVICTKDNINEFAHTVFDLADHAQ